MARGSRWPSTAPAIRTPRVAAVRSACTWGRVGFVGEGNTTTFDISQDMIRRQLTLMNERGLIGGS